MILSEDFKERLAQYLYKNHKKASISVGAYKHALSRITKEEELYELLEDFAHNPDDPNSVEDPAFEIFLDYLLI